jgi:hypothetical protein
LENLFARPKVFNLATWAEGEPILKAFAEFNSLIERVNYTQAVTSNSPGVNFLLALRLGPWLPAHRAARRTPTASSSAASVLHR